MEGIDTLSSINEYYPKHVDAIYSATLTLPIQRVCNLVYQPDRFAAWIADLKLKTHDELEQERQAPPHTEDTDPYIWGIGQHASNKETLFDARPTRRCNVGNNRKSPCEQLIGLMRILFPAADQM